MFGVFNTVRANRPSWYAFSLVSEPPPNTATDSGRRAPNSRATRSSASCQEAGRSGPPRTSRTSGVVSRTSARSTSAAVAPFPHSAPSLTGNSSRPATSTVSAAPGATVRLLRLMPHWRAQYGQWLRPLFAAPGVPVMPTTVRPRYVGSGSR